MGGAAQWVLARQYGGVPVDVAATGGSDGADDSWPRTPSSGPGGAKRAVPRRVYWTRRLRRFAFDRDAPSNHRRDGSDVQEPGSHEPLWHPTGRAAVECVPSERPPSGRGCPPEGLHPRLQRGRPCGCALAVLSRAGLGFADCDYSTGQMVDGHGRAALTAWLRQILADQTIGDIAVSPSNQPGVLGVALSRRTGESISRSRGPATSRQAPRRDQVRRLRTDHRVQHRSICAPQDGCRLQ